MTQAFSWMNKCPEIGDSLCLKFYCIIISSRDHFIFNSQSPGTTERVSLETELTDLDKSGHHRSQQSLFPRKPTNIWRFCSVWMVFNLQCDILMDI